MNYFRRDVIAPKFTRVVKAKGGANRKTVDPTINRAAQDLFDVMQELERHERTRRLNLDRAQGSDPAPGRGRGRSNPRGGGRSGHRVVHGDLGQRFRHASPPTESSPSQNKLDDCSRLGKWGTRRSSRRPQRSEPRSLGALGLLRHRRSRSRSWAGEVPDLRRRFPERRRCLPRTLRADIWPSASATGS